MISEKIQKVFAEHPEVLYGFAPNADETAQVYRSILTFAVPYGKQLSLKTYTEEVFEEGIQLAKKTVELLLKRLKQALDEERVPYRFPPAAQSNETELLAPVSFKATAVQAGLGWIGKNDVLITKEYGPRVRLYAILIDEVFQYGAPVIKSLCPVSCRLCADACPVHALRGVRWTPDIQRSDLIDYPLCNQTRSLVLLERHSKKALWIFHRAFFLLVKPTVLFFDKARSWKPQA